MTFDYDLFVIGGGSGGVRAARVAASETGAKVAIAEHDRYGGTCVIRGCVPKKLMVYASEFPHHVEEAKAYGWDAFISKFNWSEFSAKLHAELDRLEGIYRGILKTANVECYDQRARVCGPNTVELADGRQITAKFILLAMGGKPQVPQIEGHEFAITSNEVFLFNKLPKSMLIVGGGYIASEFAGIMNGLGVKTTQMYRGDQILRGFDREARDVIADQMQANGVDLRTNANIDLIEKHGDILRVRDTNGDFFEYDQVMFATGRVPNTQSMGLEKVGVELGSKGQVIVDEFSATAIPSIYAVGDITDRAALTPVAIREGMAFVETVFKNNPTAPDHDLIPTAIFTQPEMGTVGLSEEEAQKLGPIDVYTTSFKPMRSGFAGKLQKTFMKMIVCQNTQRVLGVHLVAHGAGEMIQMIGIAVKMGATKADLDKTVAVHPTMAEELVTFRNPTRKS